MLYRGILSRIPVLMFVARNNMVAIFFFVNPSIATEAHLLCPVSHSLGEDMNCIDFGFTRSKVKVTRVLFVKQLFSAQNLDKYFLHSYYIPHADCSWCGHDTIRFWIHLVKGQGHNSHL